MWLQDMAGKFGKSFYFDKYYWSRSGQNLREAPEFLVEHICNVKKQNKSKNLICNFSVG